VKNVRKKGISMKALPTINHLQERRNREAREHCASFAIADLVPFTLKGTDDDHGVMIYLEYAHKDGGKFPDGSDTDWEVVHVRVGEAMRMAYGIIHDVLKDQTVDADGNLIDQPLPERRSDIAKWLDLIRKSLNEADPISSRNQVGDQRVEVVS